MTARFRIWFKRLLCSWFGHTHYIGQDICAEWLCPRCGDFIPAMDMDAVGRAIERRLKTPVENHFDHPDFGIALTEIMEKRRAQIKGRQP